MLVQYSNVLKWGRISPHSRVVQYNVLHNMTICAHYLSPPYLFGKGQKMNFILLLLGICTNTCMSVLSQHLRTSQVGFMAKFQLKARSHRLTKQCHIISIIIMVRTPNLKSGGEFQTESWMSGVEVLTPLFLSDQTAMYIWYLMDYSLIA